MPRVQFTPRTQRSDVTFLALVALILGLLLPSIARAAEEMNADLYLELWKAEPVVVDEQCTVVEEVATCQGPNGRSSEFRWTSPPKIIELAGFDMTMSILLGGGTNGNRDYALAISDGAFLFGPESNFSYDVSADAAPGANGSNSQTFRIKPASHLYADGPPVSFYAGASGSRAHYYYIYQVKSRKGPAAQLAATIDDCPASIEISAYPPLNCHITISGFRHDTADEVEVLFPSELDSFGNHSNGIQLSGRGSLSVYNMGDPYQWGLFIFACPSQDNAGMNCYDNITAPGTTVTVPILVRQKDAGEVNLNLTLNAVARGGGAGTGTVARIGNRQRAGDFINIETGALVGGPIKFDWQSAQWELEPLSGSEYVRIKSVKQPDIFLHMESGSLEAGAVRNGLEAGEWKLIPVENTRYVRIQNHAQEDQFLHMHDGALVAGAIEDKWWSAMWWLQD